MKEGEEEQKNKTDCICVLLMHQCNWGKSCDEEKHLWSKIFAPDAEIVFFLLLLVFLEGSKFRISCRAARCGAGRNVGFEPPTFHLKHGVLTHNLILLPSTSFLGWMTKKFSGCRYILPEASCRVEGAFDWPLLPCRYIYLPHNWWGI